jgi:hypothetical protein
MANRYFKQFPLVKSPRTIILAGKIRLAADASVTSSTIDFASVTKTATGTYKITLQDKYVETKSIQLTALQASGSPVQAQVKSDSQASDKLIYINTYVQDGTSGVPAVADVAVVTEIHVLLVFKDSTTTN